MLLFTLLWGLLLSLPEVVRRHTSEAWFVELTEVIRMNLGLKDEERSSVRMVGEYGPCTRCTISFQVLLPTFLPNHRRNNRQRRMRSIEWLIAWCLTPFSTVFQLYRTGQCTYPCSPGYLLTSTPHNMLSKPLAAFLHNHCWNNGQRWERNEFYCNDYHQSSERILAEPGIEPATSCS